MPQADIADIYAKCSPAAGTDVERCGALTLCNISPTTADEFDSIYSDENGDYRFLRGFFDAEFMGRSCQIVQNGLYDFLMANRRNWGTKRLTYSPIRRGLMQVQPFVQMARKGPINNFFWTLTEGDDTPGTAPNSSAYDFTGVLASQTGIPVDTRWFPARMTIFISGKTDGGTKTETAYEIVDSVVSGDTVVIYANSQNSASYLPGDKVTTPVTGVVRRGIVNVADEESFCAQIPGLNTNQLVPFWVQTTRYDICEDELVMKYIEALRQGNDKFKQFGDVESVELNRQIVQDFQHRQAEAFFFNKPLPNQTMTTWNDLEEINVATDDAAGNYANNPFEGRCIGRRANAIGLYEQHAECGRVKDLQGQPLNIPELQRALYSIMRRRKSNNIPSQVIELYTNSFFANQLAQGFLRYFQFKSEGMLRLNIDLSRNGAGQQGPLGFWYREFAMDYPTGVTIRIVTNEFFDDLIDAHTNADPDLTSAGQVLWILDWTGNYQAIIDSNSVTNMTGDQKLLAMVNQHNLCTMRVPRRTVRLNSLTFTNVCECPQASLFLENLSSDIPEHEREVGPYDDYYGNYTGND